MKKSLNSGKTIIAKNDKIIKKKTDFPTKENTSTASSLGTWILNLPLTSVIVPKVDEPRVVDYDYIHGGPIYHNDDIKIRRETKRNGSKDWKPWIQPNTQH
mgnify:CR=1 FL=1